MWPLASMLPRRLPRLAASGSVRVSRQFLRPCTSESFRTSYAASVTDPESFWMEQSSRLKWRTPPTQAVHTDLPNGVLEFFSGGELNASENCLDRHLATKGDKAALIWERDEPGQQQVVTYRELHRKVCQLANLYKSYGVSKGDVVTIYMPMVPEAVVAMLACARIGAVHSVVFAGFSADALAQRMSGANSRLLVTADGGVRGGKTIPLKSIADNAIAKLPQGQVQTVLVCERLGDEVAWVEGRDVHLQEAMQLQRPVCPAETMAAEDSLFLLYTSGSTGNPKGMEHTTGGYLTYASLTHEKVFDLKDDDVYACVADIGWITGHSYVVYGPLCNGATSVLFESVPTYPDPSRYWEMVERLGVTQLYTAPTALRLLMQSEDTWVNKHDLSSLRVLGTVGEPINPEVWQWYKQVVGGGRCPIVDTWWQTETGGIMMTPLPHDSDAKPGAATRPLWGVEPVLLDTEGREVEGNDVSGVLCLKGATPGMARSIYGDFRRFQETYWRVYPGYYFTGDGGHRDKDGHIWVTGRVDDVINVSGHRLGTAEVESALVSEAAVAEAAVVGFPHAVKGEGIYAYVILKQNEHSSEQLLENLKKAVKTDIGPFASPDRIQVVPGLPKTSSGKIMRRILRKVAAGEFSELGDTSTLVDPLVVKKIIQGRTELFGTACTARPRSH